jgi:hypothetical protein
MGNRRWDWGLDVEESVLLQLVLRREKVRASASVAP